MCTYNHDGQFFKSMPTHKTFYIKKRDVSFTKLTISRGMVEILAPKFHNYF